MSEDSRRVRMEWEPANGDLRIHVTEMVQMLPDDVKRSLVRADIAQRDVVQAVVDAAVRGGRHAYVWLEDDGRVSDWMMGMHVGREVREKLLPLMDRAAFLLVAQFREDAAKYRKQCRDWRRHAEALRLKATDEMLEEVGPEPDYRHPRFGDDEARAAVELLDEKLTHGVPYVCLTCGNRDLAEPGQAPPCSSSPSCNGRMVEVLHPDPDQLDVLVVEFTLERDADSYRVTRMRSPKGEAEVKRRIRRLWGTYPHWMKIRCLGPDPRQSTRVREMLHTEVVGRARPEDDPVRGTLVRAEPGRWEFEVEIEDADGERHRVHVSRVKQVAQDSEEVAT